MLVAAWLPVLLALACVLWGVRVLWLALRPARIAQSPAACGHCGYPVTHPVPERCSECGKDPLRVGVVTRAQMHKRPGVLAVVIAWGLIVLVVGSIAGTMVANTFRQARAQAAMVAATTVVGSNRSITIGYQAPVDPRQPRETRGIGVGLEVQIDSSKDGSTTGTITITFDGRQGAPATIVVDLATKRTTYSNADGKDRGTPSIDEKEIATTLRNMSFAWKDGEAEAHATAIKNAVELMLDGGMNTRNGVRLEPGYAKAGLRVPSAYSTRSASSTTPGKPPPPPKTWLVDGVILSQFGIPGVVLVAGWIVLPLRCIAVRRREERAYDEAPVDGDGRDDGPTDDPADGSAGLSAPDAEFEREPA